MCAFLLLSVRSGDEWLSFQRYALDHLRYVILFLWFVVALAVSPFAKPFQMLAS